ncbi:MAG: hypothetical protein ACLFQO_11770 [Cyclobacteriaceae bacterium]
MANVSNVSIHQSVAILIDGNNIEISIHHMLGSTDNMINFDTLIPKLLNGRGLNRLTYFRGQQHFQQTGGTTAQKLLRVGGTLLQRSGHSAEYQSHPTGS